MPRNIPQRISTLPQFVEWVETVQSDWTTKDGSLQSPLFRGVGSAEFNLIPGLYRRSETTGMDVDRRLRSEFVRQVGPLVAGDKPRDSWEWYCLMQHYGMPTRLLDWTEAALVALHFALRSAVPSKLPAVWALNPWFLNETSVGTRHVLRIEDLRRAVALRAYLVDEDEPGSAGPQLPIAFAPTIIDTRMLSQRSSFTLHGSDIRGIDAIPRLRPLTSDGHLRKLILDLDAGEIRSMQMTLATCGISEVTVFPDISGLVRQVVSDFLGI